MADELKICTKCKESKTLDLFGNANWIKCGLRSNCKACDKVYREKNADKIKRRMKQYSLDNVELLRERRAISRKKRESKIKEYSKSEACRLSIKRTELKYLNAKKARGYFNKRKYKVIIPNDCQECNKPNKLEAHHHDYNLPMDVTFLCQKCHADWHLNNTQLNQKTGIFTDEK